MSDHQFTVDKVNVALFVFAGLSVLAAWSTGGFFLNLCVWGVLLIAIWQYIANKNTPPPLMGEWGSDSEAQKKKETFGSWKLFFDTLPAGMIFVDTKDLMLQYMNGTGQKLLGLSAVTPPMNMRVDRAFSSFPMIGDKFSSLMLGQEVPCFKLELDQRKLWLEVAMSKVEIDDREMIVIFMSEYQNDQHYKSEIERIRHEAELIHQTRSQFLATMSHEIRTPLNGIIGMVDILEETPLNSEQVSDLKVIRKSGHLLLNIVNDILDFSKIEANKMTIESHDFSVWKSIQEVLKMLSTRIEERSVNLIADLDIESDEMVKSDSHRFKQILMNLVGNAIKFTAQGHIVVRAKWVGPESSQRSLRVEVEDTGIGISKDNQEKLFQDFTQADMSHTRRFGGTGLGLSITKRLVELLGGQIGVESQIKEGSTFWFEIPFLISNNKDDEDQFITDELPEQEEEVKGLNVLVAEDNLVNQKVLLRMLEKKGWLVTLVENGELALRESEKQVFDMILMDMQMPVMDGCTSTKSIRRNPSSMNRDTFIVAVTANVMPEDRERCMAAGMDMVLSKPIKYIDIEEAWLRLKHR